MKSILVFFIFLAILGKGFGFKCPPDFTKYDRGCYHISSNVMTFTAAQSYCQNINSVLFGSANESDITFMKDAIYSIPYDIFPYINMRGTGSAFQFQDTGYILPTTSSLWKGPEHYNDYGTDVCARFDRFDGTPFEIWTLECSYEFEALCYAYGCRPIETDASFTMEYDSDDNAIKTCATGYETSSSITVQNLQCYSHYWDVGDPCYEACLTPIEFSATSGMMKTSSGSSRFINDVWVYQCAGQDDYFADIDDDLKFLIEFTCADSQEWEQTGSSYDLTTVECMHYCNFLEEPTYTNATTDYSATTIYTSGSQLSVTCDADFALSSNSVSQFSTCDSMGWQLDNIDLTCQLTCPTRLQLSGPTQIITPADGYNFIYDVLIYECVNLYYADANSKTSVTATCGDDQQWSLEYPFTVETLRCYHSCFWTALDLPLYSSSNYGDSSNDSYTTNSVVDVTCDLGYEFSFRSNVLQSTCSDTGWGLISDTCKFACFEEPLEPSPNSNIQLGSFSSRFLNDMVIYNCNQDTYFTENYQVSVSITCSSNGTWEQEIPFTLDTLKCYYMCYWTYPIVQENAMAQYDESSKEMYVPNYELDIICNEGFELSLNTTIQKRICHSYGWATEEVICQQICTDPPPSVGLMIVMTPMASRFMDSEVTYTCETGYYLESTVSLTITQTTLAICDGNSYTWTTERPLDCYELCLEDPPIIDPTNTVNSWVGDGSDNRRLDATIEYNCHETMIFEDTRMRNKTVTCVDTAWSYLEDVCIKACFDDPPTYINTIPSNWWNYVSLESEVVDYHCPYGYATALGKYNTTIVCQDGSWVPEDTQIPTMEVLHQVFLCEPACPGPPIPPPGYATYDFTVDFREGTIISYSCPDYFIDGNKTRYNYCVNNGPIGAWTQDELPECCTQNSIPECILTNLTAEIWWKQGDFDVIFGTEFDDMLIAHLPIFLKPNRDLGFPLKWKLEIPRINHEEVIEEIEPIFEITFTEAGKIDMLFSAYTELEGWVPMEVITGTIVSTIENLMISDDGKLGKPNVTKTVEISYDILTPLSCLIINWGDNSSLETYGNEAMCNASYPDGVYRGITINPNDYHHMYPEENMYTIDVKSFDDKVELKTSLPVVVADIACDMPEVDITDAAIYFHRPATSMKSSEISLEGISNLKCNKSVNVIRYWEVFYIDSNTGETTTQIPIKTKLSNWNFTSLAAPAAFLDIGEYKFTFTVIVEASLFINLTDSAFTFIEVIPTPLSPVLIKGSPATVQRGVLQFIDFAPGPLTIDPDEPNEPITNVTWFCRQLDETFTMDSFNFPVSSTWLKIPEPGEALGRTGGGCFGEGPGRLDLTLNEFTLQMSSFYVKSGFFEICAVMKKDIRRAKACVEIELVEKTPPLVEIQCLDVYSCEPTSKGILLNPSNEITFKGLCKDYCADDLYYAWSVERENGTLITIDDSDCTEETACNVAYGPDLNSEMLKVHPLLFTSNPVLQVANLRLIITTADRTQRMGYSLMTLIKNNPPKYGICNVTSTDKIALISKFSIFCNDWKDPEDMPIKFYTFFYNSYNNNSEISTTNLANTLNSELLAVLPFGTFELGVKISDIMDSTTTYIIGNVTTILPSEEQTNNFNMTAVEEKMDGSPLMSMYITAYNSIKAPREKASLEAMNLNQTSEENDEMFTTMSNDRKSQLGIIENTPFPTNIEQATVTSDAIASSVNLVLENDNAVYLFDTKIKSQVISLLDRTTDSVLDMEINSVDQIFSLVRNTMKSKYAITKSTNIVLENNNKIPVGDAALASNLDYDVDVGEDMPGSLEEMYLMNALKIIRENTKGQTKQLDNLLSKQCGQISKRLNKNDVVHISIEVGLSLIISKVNEELLESKSFTLQSQEDPKAAITIPKSFCPSSYLDDLSICIEDFEIRLLISDIDTRSYSLNKHYLSKLSRVMSVEIFSAEKLIKIKDQKPPIHLTVPHNSHEVRESRKYVNVSEHLQTEIPLVYHKINVSLPRAALILCIKPSNYQNLVILIDHERYPTPDNHIMKFHIKEFNYNNGEYTLVLNSEKIMKRSGIFILAVGKVKIDHETYLNNNISINDLQKEFNSNYEISIYMSACYYFDETVDLWKYDMDLVVTNFNYSHTDCSSTHLTEFGLGFTSLMISTSFSLTLAAVEILGGISMMVVLAFIFSTFLIILVFAIFKDFGDKKKLFVIPLPDNDIYHEYIYEITFYTGPSSESTCESNIYIILCGEEAETEIRSLPRSKSLYRRYNKDTFVMTVPKSLGRIHSIRIMHDNSGRPPYDSWELEKVVIFDPHVRETFLFEINSVLTLDRDDHHIDQKFQTSEFSNKTFSQKFYTNFHNSINEDHIWLSIFQCSPGSRYRSKERVLVAALFMFVSICVSSLFFNYGIQDIEGFSYKVWSLRISILEILVALVSIVCTYPIPLVFSYLFKRTDIKKLSESRLMKALELQRNQQLEKLKSDKKDGKPTHTTKKKKSKIERKVKPHTKIFPSFVRILSYFGGFVLIIVSIVITIMISSVWREILVKKLIITTVLIIFLSILVTEFIRVVIVTFIEIKRKPFHFQDKDCDEIMPNLAAKHKSLKINTSEVQRINLVKGIKKRKIEVTSQYLKDEREMAFATKETLLYCLYLIVLLIIASDRMDRNAFHLKEHFTNSLVREKHDLENLRVLVNKTDDFWHFVTERLLEDIRAQRWYNGQPPFGLRGFLNDKANRIMGFPILRQIRNARFVCHVPEDMHEHIRECSGPHSIATEFEDTRDYCAGWSSEVNSTLPCDFNEFKYSSGEELDTFAITGRLATYGSGGYVTQLFGTKASIKSRLKELMQYQWIDKKTRAVLLEFSVYNANVNLFCVCRISFEFFEGIIQLKWDFEAVKLLKIGNNLSDQITLICELIFVVATVLFTLNEIWEMKQQKCSYFTQYWNIAELTILILSYIEVFLYIYRNMLISSAVEVFNRTKGNQYVRIDYAVLIEQYYHEILAIITFVSLLKLIKLMQFNKEIIVLSRTIKLCWGELSYFFILFAVIYLSFCFLFYLMFSSSIMDYSRISTAILSTFKMMLGKSNISEMTRVNRFAPIMFFFFSVLNSMMLINIMLAIIINAFETVRTDLEENQLNIVGYMMRKLKQKLLMQPNPVHSVSPDFSLMKAHKAFNEEDDDRDEKLPTKVNQFLDELNKLYFNGKMNIDEEALQMKREMLLRIKSKRRSEYELLHDGVYHCD